MRLLLSESQEWVLQASNGDLAPKKPPGSSTVKDAVSDGKLANFNDRLHEVR